MVNQLMKFTPYLAEMTKPLRDLLSKDSSWCWEQAQKSAFSDIKTALTYTESPTLALFNPERETIVSADASAYGLGAVLLQRQPSSELRPVAYISRSMSATEQRYAQIEKEALALTWACERFSEYLIGISFHIQTDHKPLVPLLSTKLLDELPIRVQRFRMRLLRYDFTISHIPGQDLVTADALSRAPVSNSTASDQFLEEEVDAYIQAVIDSLPASEGRLAEIREAQQQDELCQEVIKMEGWPAKHKLVGLVKKFHPMAGELAVDGGLLMRGNHLVIPSALQAEVLTQLHVGHQGIQKCRERAKQSVWWPGLSGKIEELVRSCPECIKFQSQRAEPMRPTQLPELPWQRVATDLFEWQKSTYLLIVDYFSRWIEIARLDQTTATAVIQHTSSIFARHGIPEVVISDNGPQYTSDAYSAFSEKYGFRHITSNPYHPQGNGEAERAVQTIKRLLKKSGDPYLALMAYRATPLEVGYSPSELLMGRKLRTTVPTVQKQLKPRTPDYTDVNQELKERQRDNYDAHHGARKLPSLQTGESVWLSDRQTFGEIVEETAPRSYHVQTEDGAYRRNRRHIVSAPSHDFEEFEDTGDTSPVPSVDEHSPQPAAMPSVNEPSSTSFTHSPKKIVTRSLSGKLPKPMDRLDPSWTKS